MAHKDHAPRILGGRLKGRALSVAPGRLTRPLKALARRSLFDILADRLPGASVLDLFAGAGTVGLEAISRGAERVVLVESAAAARRALAESVAALGVADRVTIDGREAIHFVADAPRAEFDVVFVGPPYRLYLGEERATLARVLAGAARCIAPHGTLVLESTTITSVPTLPDLTEVDRRNYGETVLHFFTRCDDSEPQAPDERGR